MSRYAFAALCALAAVLAALLCVAAALAGARPGEVRQDGPSWWWGAFATARIVGGEGGMQCADDGACVVWAQGAWSLVEVDGQTVAARLWLPVVR